MHSGPTCCRSWGASRSCPSGAGYLRLLGTPGGYVLSTPSTSTGAAARGAQHYECRSAGNCASVTAPQRRWGAPAAIVICLTALVRPALSASITDLGTLGNLSSGATAINASGQVVGYLVTPGGVTHAFFFQGGRMT